MAISMLTLFQFQCLPQSMTNLPTMPYFVDVVLCPTGTKFHHACIFQYTDDMLARTEISKFV